MTSTLSAKTVNVPKPQQQYLTSYAFLSIPEIHIQTGSQDIYR